MPTAPSIPPAGLLTAVSAPQADEIEKMKMELLRLRFDEQVRSEKRKSAGDSDREPRQLATSSHGARSSLRTRMWPAAATSRQSLPPISGRCIWAKATDEYRNPVEFFRRTYLTESLKRMLVGAVQRLAGQGGDPVVQLQTNFGGGKTHSMLALYHLFSGIAPKELSRHRRGPGRGRSNSRCPTYTRVVLVGNKISPGNPVTKPDGTVVRTLWGELAWQLGIQLGVQEAKKAFSAYQGRRRKGHQPRRRSARTVQRVWTVPDPDR